MIADLVAPPFWQDTRPERARLAWVTDRRRFERLAEIRCALLDLDPEEPAAQGLMEERRSLETALGQTVTVPPQCMKLWPGGSTAPCSR